MRRVAEIVDAHACKRGKFDAIPRTDVLARGSVSRTRSPTPAGSPVRRTGESIGRGGRIVGGW